MFDISGHELNVGDRIVYQYHGHQDGNGIQPAIVRKVHGDGTVTVQWADVIGKRWFADGRKVQLKRGGLSVLRVRGKR